MSSSASVSSAAFPVGAFNCNGESAGCTPGSSDPSFLVRSRNYLKSHFQYAFKPGAEATIQGGLGFAHALDTDANGKNGTNLGYGGAQGHTSSGHRTPPHGGKNPAAGTTPDGTPLDERTIGKEKTRVLSHPTGPRKYTAKNRLTAAFKSLGNAIANAITGTLPRLNPHAHGKSAIPTPAPQNVGGAPDVDEEPENESATSPDAARSTYSPARNNTDFAELLRQSFPGLKFETFNSKTVMNEFGLPVRVDPNDPSAQGACRPRTVDAQGRIIPSAIEEQHERDLAELSTRLDRLKGLLPSVGNFFALPFIDALAQGCHGDARLAIDVLDEMERVRIISKADMPGQHDKQKAALACLSRLDTWLTFTKPRLTLQPKGKRDEYFQPTKVFSKSELQHAFTRTAALLSDTSVTTASFDALCLAIGALSPEELRAEKNLNQAYGSAGPHRLDPGQSEIGKRLLLTSLQALREENGHHTDNKLATRVNAATRKIAALLSNEKIMRALPHVQEAQADAQAHPNGEMPNAQGLGDILHRRHAAERVEQKKRINILIDGSKELGIKGIGSKAFVDLECWLNNLHTDDEVNRLGRMALEFAKDYQISERIEAESGRQAFGPFKFLNGDVSVLRTRKEMKADAAGNKHPDEDHLEAVKTVGQILSAVQAPEAPSLEYRAAKVCRALLAAGCTLAEDASADQKRIAIEQETIRLAPFDQQDIRAYCQIFAPHHFEAGADLPTLETLFLQDNLCNSPLSHQRRRELSGLAMVVVDRAKVEGEVLDGLRAQLFKLGMLNTGEFSHQAGMAEELSRTRQMLWLHRQDNTEGVSDGVTGTFGLGGDAPLTPDGLLKLSLSLQFRAGLSKELRTASENHGNQMALGYAKSHGVSYTAALVYGEKFKISKMVEGEGGAGGEYSLAQDSSRFTGCQITVKRDAMNLVVGDRPHTELAKAQYKDVGEFAEFRVLSAQIEDFHRRLACNPDNLTPEQLKAQYPKELRPTVTLSPEDMEVSAFSHKTYTPEMRRAMRDPMREAKLAKMSGQEYFRQFFLEFRHDDHAIAFTENHRDVDSTKHTGGVFAKAKATIDKVFSTEVQVDLKHTHSKEVDNRYDTKGSYLFQYILNHKTESTNVGARAEIKGLMSRDDSLSARVAANRRIGYTLERDLIKIATSEGKTVDFYTYCGQNFSNFKEFEKEVEKDRKAWGVMLRDTPLDRAENISDEEYRVQQEAADQQNLNRKLEFLRKLDPHQSKQFLVRMRMRASASLRFDHIRAELDYSEKAISKTVERLKKLSPDAGPEARQHLKDRLTRLQNAVDMLLQEKIALLSNSTSWEVFGLGTGRIVGASHSSGVPIDITTAPSDTGDLVQQTPTPFTMLMGPLKFKTELTETRRVSDSAESGWLKSDPSTSEYSHRLGLRDDLERLDHLYCQSVLEQTDLVALADAAGGVAHAKISPERIPQIAAHIDTQIRLHAQRNRERETVSGPQRTAQDIANQEASARLCRHLLTFERTDLIENLIDDGCVSLQSVLEQAVHAKRIGLVSWILDTHAEDINGVARARRKQDGGPAKESESRTSASKASTSRTSESPTNPPPSSSPSVNAQTNIQPNAQSNGQAPSAPNSEPALQPAGARASQAPQPAEDLSSSRVAELAIRSAPSSSHNSTTPNSSEEAFASQHSSDTSRSDTSSTEASRANGSSDNESGVEESEVDNEATENSQHEKSKPAKPTGQSPDNEDASAGSVQHDSRTNTWDLRAALAAMTPKERAALLYGLTVRDWEHDRPHRASNPAAYQGPDESYTATGWQGRTHAIGGREVAKERGSRKESVDRSVGKENGVHLLTEDDSTHSVDTASLSLHNERTEARSDVLPPSLTHLRAQRGLQLDRLVQSGAIDRQDLMGMMKVYPGLRTLDCVLSHAHSTAKMRENGYTVNDTEKNLPFDILVGSTSTERRHLFRKHALSHADIDVALELGRAFDLRGFEEVSFIHLVDHAIHHGDVQRTIALLRRPEALDFHHISSRKPLTCSADQLVTLLGQLNSPDLRDILVQFSWAHGHDPLALLVTAVRTGNDAVVDHLIYTQDEFGRVELNSAYVARLCAQLTKYELRYLASRLSLADMDALLRGRFEVNSASKVCRSLMRQGYAEELRRYLDGGLITLEEILRAHARQALDTRQINTLLSLFDGAPLMTALRAVLPAGTTVADFLVSKVDEKSFQLVEKILMAEPEHVPALVQALTDADQSQRIDSLLNDLHGEAYWAMVRAKGGSLIGPVFKEVIDAKSQHHFDKMLAENLDLNAAIAECTGFGRRYLARLVSMLGPNRLDSLATTHLLRVLSYGLSRNEEDERIAQRVLQDIGANLSRRLRQQQSDHPNFLRAVSLANVTEASANRLLNIPDLREVLSHNDVLLLRAMLQDRNALTDELASTLGDSEPIERDHSSQRLLAVH